MGILDFIFIDCNSIIECLSLEGVWRVFSLNFLFFIRGSWVLEGLK